MYSLATKGIIFLDNHRCFPFLGLVSRIPNFDSQLHPPRGPGYPVSRTIPFGWRGRFQFLLPTCLVQLVLPDGKNSRDASGIVEPKLHRALFPSSRRDSGEGTRHSALKNAKDARTLLIWFRTLLYLFLSTEAWSSFSFFPPHRSPSLPLPPPSPPRRSPFLFTTSSPVVHPRIRPSATLESTPSSRTSPDQQRRSTLDCPIRPGLPLSRR